MSVLGQVQRRVVGESLQRYTVVAVTTREGRRGLNGALNGCHLRDNAPHVV